MFYGGRNPFTSKKGFSGISQCVLSSNVEPGILLFYSLYFIKSPLQPYGLSPVHPCFLNGESEPR